MRVELSAELIEPLDSDVGICSAARVSFNKDAKNFSDKKNSGLLKYLFTHVHWSPFAHARETYGIDIEDADLLHFLLNYCPAGFTHAQDAFGHDIVLNGSLWAWYENLKWLPGPIQDRIIKDLCVRYPFCAELMWPDGAPGLVSDAVIETGYVEHLHVPDSSAIDYPQLQYISFRVKLPIFLARQATRHQVHLTPNETCFDASTEVFTEDGWKFWPSVTSEDKIASVTAKGTYSFERPVRLIQGDFSGELMHITSRDLDLLCTPNHELYMSHYAGNSWTDWRKEQAKDAVNFLFAKIPAVPKLIMGEGSEKDYWEGKVYGAFLGDGSISKDQARVYFHVKRESKKEMIRELGRNTPTLDWNENLQDDGYSYFRMRPSGTRFTGKTWDKQIEFSKSDTRQWLLGVLDGLMETDGTYTKKGVRAYSTVSAQLRDSICTLGDYLGFEVTWSTRPAQGNWRPAFKMTLKKPQPKLLKRVQHIPYVGKVFCAESVTGLILVRRNGKKAVVGNSRRYVSTTPELWTPPSGKFRAAPLEGIKQGSTDELIDYHFKQEWDAHMEQALFLYENMLAAGIAPEDARMHLPQNMMTEWIWTGSLPAWRRVCKDRLAPGAQKYIRDWAEQIFRALSEKYPQAWLMLWNR